MYQFEVTLLTASGELATRGCTGEEELFTGVVTLGQTRVWVTQIIGVIHKDNPLERMDDVKALELTIINEFGKILAVAITKALLINFTDIVEEPADGNNDDNPV